MARPTYFGSKTPSGANKPYDLMVQVNSWAPVGLPGRMGLLATIPGTGDAPGQHRHHHSNFLGNPG